MWNKIFTSVDKNEDICLNCKQLCNKHYEDLFIVYFFMGKIHLEKLTQCLMLGDL